MPISLLQALERLAAKRGLESPAAVLERNAKPLPWWAR